MPDLDTDLHLAMLRESRQTRERRILEAIRLLASETVYGIEWGVVELVPPLLYVRNRFVLPYIAPTQTAVEIGVGGGRWTKYLLGFGKLYAVDYYQEILDELRANYNRENMEFIKNNGTDFPGIADASADYIFSFGTFVHLEIPLIETYFENIRRILKPGGNVVVQYSDKTKVMAQLDPGFSQNAPDTMRRIVCDRGYRIVEEDTTSLWHSAILRCTV